MWIRRILIVVLGILIIVEAIYLSHLLRQLKQLKLGKGNALMDKGIHSFF